MSKHSGVEFTRLKYKVKDDFFHRTEKVILNGISGQFRSCELSAVMGASGSGKSSLLNILSGFVKKGVSGSIKVNGVECDDELLQLHSTYIMQEENLYLNLTVKEAMNFAVKFKTGDFFAVDERRAKIKSILRTLSLDDKLERFTGDLSGGERKRLSIAVELVDDPPTIFLDEPTTGLDSSSSTQCIQLLKKLAKEGKTIICTIHTPSALLFELFDHVYVLAEGHCVYQGSSKNSVHFLLELDLKCPENYNPADFLLEIATNDYGYQNHRLVKKIENGSNDEFRTSASINNNADDEFGSTRLKIEQLHLEKEHVVYNSTFLSQFFQLLYRNFLFQTRDRMFLLMRLLVHLSVAFTIGLLYFKIGHQAAQVLNIFRFVAIAVGFLAYSGFYSLMVRFPLDLPILKREHFNRWYSSSAYYLALLISDIPIIILCSISYISIIYYLTDQPMELFRFSNFLLIGTLTNFTAQSYGLLMGSAFDLKTGLIIAAILMALHVLFGGFFIVYLDIPSYFQWMFDTTYLKHSIEGAGSLIFGYNRSKLHCDEIYCHFTSPETFKKFVGIKENLPTVYSSILITLFTVHIVAYWVMRYRLKN